MIHNHSSQFEFDNANSSAIWSSWSRQEDKLFERALVMFPEGTPKRWEKIASQVPGKTSVEVQKRYEDLVRDLKEIDSGLVELPSYEDELDSPGRGTESETSQVWLEGKGKARESSERRKGVPWTAEEHRHFLIGLEKYGKGDWRSISRNAVVSRTPTQVASHAQKYFLRLNSIKKEKRDPAYMTSPPLIPTHLAKPTTIRIGMLNNLNAIKEAQWGTTFSDFPCNNKSNK